MNECEKEWIENWLPNKIRSVYDGSKICIRINRMCSVKFSMELGLRQGCVASPGLFIILWSINVQGELKERKDGGRKDFWSSLPASQWGSQKSLLPPLCFCLLVVICFLCYLFITFLSYLYYSRNNKNNSRIQTYIIFLFSLQQHPCEVSWVEGFHAKVGLELIIFWFLDSCLNH